MNTIENPLLIALLAGIGAILGQLFCGLFRRDINSLRNSHFWLDHPLIKQIYNERDLQSASKRCLPGMLLFVGGLPQALAVATSFTTFTIGLKTSWWCVVVAPIVYVGTEVVVGSMLRSFVRNSLLTKTKNKEGEQGGDGDAEEAV